MPLVGIAALLLAAAGPAKAQLDQSETSTIRERTPGGEQTAPPPLPDQVPPPDLPPTPVEGGPAIAPETVVLAAVLIEGATAFPAAELNALYADDLARPLTLADVEALAARITSFYSDAGYLLTRAVVLPQALESGVLRLRVVEGAVLRVVFEGEGTDSLALKEYVHRIRDERPLKLDTLERQLLLLEDLPGLAVSDSRVRALDEEAGDYELIVTLEVARYDLLTFLDNRGTHAIGPLEFWTAVGANSPMGRGERLQVGAFTIPNQTSELQYYEGSYSQPLGSQGTRLNLLLSSSNANPSGDFTGNDVRIRSTGASIGVSHPALRLRDETLRLSADFDYQDSREERFAQATIDDRLRVLRLRADYVADGFLDATHYAGLEFSRGLGILGASDPGSTTLSRSDGRSDFTKLEGYVSRSQSIGDYWGAQISLAGQFSQDPLLSSEEFGLGGGTYGRAYNYYEISGDHGLATAAELRYGKLLNDDPWLDSFQLYGFYDWGAVWNENADDDFAMQTLASAGVGLRLGLLERFSLDLQVARPLTRVPFETDSKTARIFFSLTGRF
ncbi:MAG: ShlB/FhaC/HecB family hemolysin secretion/activation protein [Deltaproteobacteria bacterium]|nr:ShlB/FhaC/HecB family hemolysin secretion/activation protein [Deltaproteobacteria bacterium]